MKQKNLILVAVAVGCGLVAAFLTTQLGAGQKKVDDTVEVPVAAKDLPVGTKLTKEHLKDFVTYKKVSKEALPVEFASSEEQLADKRLIRTVRTGETFNPQDLTTHIPISPPPGFNVMTFGITAERGVAGFAGPGAKVDVLASIPMRKQAKSIVIPVAIDMLVLAIDANTQGNQTGAFPNLSMVSLAVTTSHAAILHATISRGADIRLILRHTDKPPVYTNIPTEEEIWAILADDDKKATKEGGSETAPEPKSKEDRVTTIKLPVPVEDMKAGTLLTAEVLKEKFKYVDYLPPAPTAFVQNLSEHAGKYLTKDLSADQFVPKTSLGDKPPVKPGPEDTAPPKTGPTNEPPPTPKKVEDKPVYFDTTVTTAAGVKKYRYQVMKDGTTVFLGELKDDGTVLPVPGQGAAPESKPEAKPSDEKKGDRVIRS